jgi:hypothetical protein
LKGLRETDAHRYRDNYAKWLEAQSSLVEEKSSSGDEKVSAPPP